MLYVMFTALVLSGGATWCVLNRATTTNPRRNAVASRFLLSASGVLLAVGLGAGLVGLL